MQENNFQPRRHLQGSQNSEVADLFGPRSESVWNPVIMSGYVKPVLSECD